MNILVTGASKGIGFELCRLFAIEGHHVIAIARSCEKLKLLREDCLTLNRKCRIDYICFDITEFDRYHTLSDHIRRYSTEFDIIINNAGSLINKPFHQVTPSEFDQVYDTNVKAVYFLTQMLIPLLRSDAHIVNISSMGGVQGSRKFAGLSAYASSKGAVAVLTECLALELEGTGIRINCLALGSAQTEMLEKAFPEYQAPLSAGEMAQFIRDFAIKGRRFFNGKILPVALSTP